MLDTVLQTVPSCGALCIILGSCRLPKNRLSKAALPGRVVMSKAHFMVCRRKRKSSEFPRGTESCHLKLASGLLFVCVHTRCLRIGPAPCPHLLLSLSSLQFSKCRNSTPKERVDCFRALGHMAELRGEHRSERSLGLLTRSRSSALEQLPEAPQPLGSCPGLQTALFRGPDTIPSQASMC